MLTDYLDRGARIAPAATCIMRPDGSGRLDYAAFADLTHRIAWALDERESLGPGNRVAVFAPNSPMAFAAVVGVLRSGAAWVALNPRSQDDELAHLLQAIECEFLLYDTAFDQRGQALLASIPTLRGSVAFGEGAHDAFAEWMGDPGVRARERTHQSDAPAMYMGTGGTTGLPKGVPLSHRQLLLMCLGFEAHMHEPTPPVYLMATPMTHAAGGVALPILSAGGTIIAHDGVHPDEIFDSIERHRVTRLFLPPTAIYVLLAAPDVRRRDFSSLRHFVYGASAISVDKLVEAMEVFGPVMAQVFGQSEVPLICTYLSPRDHAEALADPALRQRLASCGRPSVVARVEIMDDDGRLLSAGQQGEIVVRGDLVMAGYYKNPQATAEVQCPGGWHGTGDIGYIDEAGFVHIVDRKRDMIVSGGFNVFPSEVEQVLWAHDAVLDCAVIGVPDVKWGEAVTAIVETKAGRSVSEQELIDLCKERLGSVRAPKAVRFRSLPRSSAGKVLKRALRDEYWAGRERRV